jgi:hypothetical protein
MYRKSTYSQVYGNCVEVDAFRKSSHSFANGGCVEVGDGSAIAVRDTTNREGGTLLFTSDAWEKFTGSLR